MGAWGVLAFDNDEANDWAYGLEESDDLSAVQSALSAVDAAGADYLDGDTATEALAACEVLARLEGRPGYKNAYTQKVDEWVSSHPIKPDPQIIQQGSGSSTALWVRSPSFGNCGTTVTTARNGAPRFQISGIGWSAK